MTKQFALLAFVGLIAGCGAPVAADGGSTKPAEITTGVVKKQDLTGYSFFDGKLVIPDTAKATAYSPYDTPVVSVMTSLGKHVGRGDSIVKLTIPGADSAAEIAKANASSAKSNYATDKAGLSGPVRDAERALADAKAAEKAAQDTVASGGTADVEAATQARVTAESVLKQAQQALQDSLQPSKAAADQASIYANAAMADARKGLIRAPITGTVVALEAKPGMMAKSRQEMATIINFDAVRVQGLVPPELKDTVAKGSRVLIAMQGPSSDPVEGRVLDVSVVPPTEGQKSAGYLAVIEFRDPEKLVQPISGVKRIGVKTGTVSDALVVPVGAITKRDGKSYVNVQTDGKWVETAVETGLTDGALVEIKSGLSEGSTVRIVSQPQDIDRLP